MQAKLDLDQLKENVKQRSKVLNDIDLTESELTDVKEVKKNDFKRRPVIGLNNFKN